MTLIEVSTTINKPAEKVFAHIINPDNMKNEYVVSIKADGPLKVGTKIKTKVKSTQGVVNEIVSEVVAFEKNKVYGTKTYGTPPASDVVSTYVLEADGSGTKLTMKTEASLMPAGMPSMPGMEDMIKKQMVGSYESTLAALKKAIEG
ncbi:MAG: SRPBCC family protein [Chloroflexi bacterium]|nr:SRPBCC family protein [Chloroflexota bacterium]